MSIDNIKQIYSVSQINQQIRNFLHDHFFQTMWINGEVTNYIKSAAGHIYFSLKDEEAQISCVMFRSQNQHLTFDIENGLDVIASAKVEIYSVRGTLQLIIQSIEPAGTGILQIRYEQLKNKLAKEGLFESTNKKDIPTHPNIIGIITSASGAALHDTLMTLKKRCSSIEIIIYPASVQGKNAVNEICKQLQTANTHNDVDVLLLIRGGGSFEDLQAFNEEKVARAVANSRIPIVSGIGHETDSTITDFVSDYRALTPTAAAVKVSLDMNSTISSLDEIHNYLKRLLLNYIEKYRNELTVIKERIEQCHPCNIINERNQQIDSIHKQLHLNMRHLMKIKCQEFEHHKATLLYNAPIDKINYTSQMINSMTYQLNNIVRNKLERYRQILNHSEVTLRASNPNTILQKGYALVTDTAGKIMNSTKGIKIGQSINIKIGGGELKALVNKIKRNTIRDNYGNQEKNN